jgi:glycogen synthase
VNVLMTADTVGGVFVYALELAAALGRTGTQVALAAKGRVLSADQWDQARRVPGLEVFESHDKLEWMEDPWEDVARSSAWLLELEQRLAPDVVHLNDYAHGALPFAAPRLVVGHSCVFSWFEAVRRRRPPPSFDRYRTEVARGLAGADLVVAPTRYMLAALERHYGALPRTRVIPNGRSAARFRPGEKEPFILCAGRLWDEAKNAQLLDAIADRLPWPVLLAGEDAHPDPARRGAARPRHARPLGRLPPESLACFYRRASIYALPARYEPFGLSILEAALAGCVLVVGDTPSLREVWEGAALFVDPDSPELLRTMLAGLIERPDLRATLGAAARERGLAHTPERMAEAYAAAYRDLLADRSAEAPGVSSCAP